MRRTLKVLEGVRDGRGRLCRLLLVGGSELLVFVFCVEDAVGGGGSQPLGAIEVEWRVVPGLDHQITGLDFAGTGLGYVLAVRGAVEHISGFLCLNSKAESNRKKGKGRAQITARRTESRTKRARHRKKATRQKATEKRQTARTNNSEKHGKQNEKGEAQKKTAATREEQRQ